MQTESIYSIIIALITVLGSAGAWGYYEKRSQRKKKEEDYIKDNFTKRVDKLEKSLEQTTSEKDELIQKIIKLTKEVSELNTKVTYLELENKRLLEVNNQILSLNRNSNK